MKCPFLSIFLRNFLAILLLNYCNLCLLFIWYILNQYFLHGFPSSTYRAWSDGHRRIASSFSSWFGTPLGSSAWGRANSLSLEHSGAGSSYPDVDGCFQQGGAVLLQEESSAPKGCLLGLDFPIIEVALQQPQAISYICLCEWIWYRWLQAAVGLLHVDHLSRPIEFFCCTVICTVVPQLKCPSCHGSLLGDCGSAKGQQGVVNTFHSYLASSFEGDKSLNLPLAAQKRFISSLVGEYSPTSYRFVSFLNYINN